MRTYEEIAEKVRISNKTFFDFSGDALLGFLPYEYAKPFLKEEVTAEDWKAHYIEYTPENVINEMNLYMPFAWEKALDHKGLSSMRSVQKMRAWLWLLEDEACLSENEVSYYGTAVLYDISTKYGFPIGEDDRDREKIENMRQGKPCREDCLDGCKNEIEV